MKCPDSTGEVEDQSRVTAFLSELNILKIR